MSDIKSAITGSVVSTLSEITACYIRERASGKSRSKARKNAGITTHLVEELKLEDQLGLSKPKIIVQTTAGVRLGGSRLYETLISSHLEYDEIEVLKTKPDGKWRTSLWQKAASGYTKVSSVDVPYGRQGGKVLGTNTWMIKMPATGKRGNHTRWYDGNEESLRAHMRSKGYTVVNAGRMPGIMHAQIIEERERSKSRPRVEVAGEVRFDDTQERDRARQILSNIK